MIHMEGGNNFLMSKWLNANQFFYDKKVGWHLARGVVAKRQRGPWLPIVWRSSGLRRF